MKNYLAEMIDLTGDNYLNPVPAVYDNGKHPRSVSTIKSISIHHDATNRPHDYNSIDRYHAEAKGHYERLGPGLQYHYKIDNVGQIFAIRPLTTWLYSVGSVENETTLAICLDGNFENQKPTREQYEALFELLKNLCTEHPEFPATWPDVRPHADFSATACCGASLRDYIYAIKDEATAAAYPAVAFDWPESQPSTSPVPPAVVPTPPTPPVIPPVAPVTPPPTPSVEDQSHAILVENNGLLKQILALLTELITNLKGIFKWTK